MSRVNAIRVAAMHESARLGPPRRAAAAAASLRQSASTGAETEAAFEWRVATLKGRRVAATMAMI